MRYLQIYFFLLVLTGFQSVAQDHASKYTTGRQLIRESRWSAAMQVFLPLTSSADPNPYSEYSHYWYSLAAFNERDYEASKSMLFQLIQRYPEWSRKDDAYYLLANVYFEQQKPRLALQFASKIRKPDSDLDAMKVKYLSEIKITDTILALQRDYNKDLILAKILAKRISTSKEEKDKMLFQYLVQEYKLDAANILPAQTGVKKAQYRVALLLPFSLNELNVKTSKRSNQYVLDLYEGIQLALDSINKKSDSVKVFLYDTEKEVAKINEILALPEMKDMDLIVGPVYPLQIPIVTDFGSRNRIAVVNPLSSNTKYAEGNEFSWLFQSTLEQQASVASRYAATTMVYDTISLKRGQEPVPVEKRDVIIFYGKEARDSIMALRYRDSCIKQGLKVYRFEKITRDKVNLMRTLLGDTVKVKMLNHIFVSTSDEVLAANVTSLMESSKQNTPIIARSEWLGFNLLSYDLFERLNVHFIHPEYYDFTDSAFVAFRKKYFDRTGLHPSQYSVIGYELMCYFGSALKANGTYWRTSFDQKGLQKGAFIPGIDLRYNHCNSFVPLTRFENRKIKVLNPVK